MMLTVTDLFKRIQTNPQDYAVNIDGLGWFVVLGITDNAITMANNSKVFGMTLICQRIKIVGEQMFTDPTYSTHFIGMGPGNILEVIQKTIPKVVEKRL